MNVAIQTLESQAAEAIQAWKEVAASWQPAAVDTGRVSASALAISVAADDDFLHACSPYIDSGDLYTGQVVGGGG